MCVLEPRQRPMLAPVERAHLEDHQPVGQFGLCCEIDRPFSTSSQFGEDPKAGQLVSHAEVGGSRRLGGRNAIPANRL
jgi:hypothetical protein